MRPYLFLFVMILSGCLRAAMGQSCIALADSLRIKHKIPELAYAVVSADSVLETHITGVHKISAKNAANINDRFRIGSCTKTITAFIAALQVKQGKIKWDTKFFDLYPEMKAGSNAAYHNLTLQDLTTWRAPLIKWTYTDPQPSPKRIQGDSMQQRYHFMEWVFKQSPVAGRQPFYWSNPAYTAVGMMLEKASGITYETMVTEFGNEIGIHFGFGQPNYNDTLQPWGHNANLKPEAPALNEKLNWLAPAGNINISLPDYAKFIQMQLKGLAGQSEIFTLKEFETMYFGLPYFSYGWQSYFDETTNATYAFHEGNPGTFLSKTYICKETNKAFIIFANVQSDEAEAGMDVLLNELTQKYRN